MGPPVDRSDTPAPDVSGNGAPGEDPGAGGMRARVERTRRRVSAVVQKVEEAAPHHPALAAGTESLRTDRAVAGSLLGGAMAFRLFLWLVPAVLVVVSGMGLVTSAGVTDAGGLSNGVGMSRLIAESIASNSSTGSFVGLVIGLFALWFAGIGAFKAMWIIHQLAWHIPVAPPRGAWKGGLVFTGTMYATLLLAGLVGRARSEAPGLGLAFTILFVLVYVLVWFVASLFLPGGDVSPRALVPGALLFGVGMQGLHMATVLYFAGRVAHASEVYGPLGVAIGLLAWLYVMGRLVVAAPVLNAVVHARHRGSERPEPSAGPPDEERSTP